MRGSNLKERILIVDDHCLIVDTLLSIINGAWEYDAQTASNVSEAIEVIGKSGPFDLILLDYQLPGVTDLSGLEMIMSANSGKTALFSGVAGRSTIRRALKLGACGWVPKTSALRTFRSAIELMLVGEVYVPASFSMSRHSDGIQTYGLKERELRVLELLCNGMPNKEISARLDIDLHLVKLDVKSICTKFGVSNRTQAVIVANKEGIV